MGFESIDQPSQSSEVEHNPKMSISFLWLERGGRWSFQVHWTEVERNPKMSILFFWLERGGRWGSSPSTSPADHQKLNVIQKWAFFFLARQGGRWGSSSTTSQAFKFFLNWRGVVDRDHQKLSPLTCPLTSQSSEVKCNPKMSILFFWLERGGRWGSSPLTSPADHQKLNVIQKWAFYFLAGEGWQMGFESIEQMGIIKSWSNPILFLWLERGGRWSSSPLNSLADHQKLNVIQKWAFYFFDWRGVAERVQVHQPAQPIIRSWT